MMLTKSVLIFTTLCTAYSYTPNIIIITADDIGSDDIGFLHKGQGIARTRFLDYFAPSLTVLENYYVMPNGHSSRTALLTGKHPAVLGTQFEMKDGTLPYGLDPSHTLLAEYLKEELGYSCHAIGQWDLGFYSEDMLPTKRGYDSFYGSYLSYGDYKTHQATDQAGHTGLDLHDNMELDDTQTGKFKPELYTDKAIKVIKDHDVTKPLHLYLSLQSAQIDDIDVLCKRSAFGGKIPNDYYEGIRNIDDHTRKCYLALVQAVDTAFGSVIEALRSKLMIENSVVIFTSTSGGPAAGQHNFNAASNFPYRGAKLTGWQGGVRGLGLIYSEKLESQHKQLSSCLFHITDWIPTVLSLYSKLKDLDKPLSLDKFSPMYGVDQYDCVFGRGPNSRKSIIHFLHGNSASILDRNYKYVVNLDRKLESLNEWYSGDSGDVCGTGNTLSCDPQQSACLFDIEEDPCEKRNIAVIPTHSSVITGFKATIASFNKTVKYSEPHKPDSRGNPANFDYAWQPWTKSVNRATSICSTSLSIISTVIALTLKCLL